MNTPPPTTTGPQPTERKIRIRLGLAFYAGLAVLGVAAALGWIHAEYYSALGWTLAAFLMYCQGHASTQIAGLRIMVRLAAAYCADLVAANARLAKEVKARGGEAAGHDMAPAVLAEAPKP